MTKEQLVKALKNKEDKLDIISMVTGVSEERLNKIIEQEDMTQQEFIILHVHS